jgi:hypothetical protein
MGISGWEYDPNLADPPYLYTVWDSEDSEGCVGSGSVKVDQPNAPALYIEPRRCIAIGENQRVNFGAKFKTNPGTASYCAAFEMSDSSCFVDLGLQGHRVGGGTSTNWTAASTSFTTVAGTRALFIECFMQGKMDQMYLNTSVNMY